MDRNTPWITFIYLLCNGIFISWDCIYMNVAMCPVAERRERLIFVFVHTIEANIRVMVSSVYYRRSGNSVYLGAISVIKQPIILRPR